MYKKLWDKYFLKMRVLVYLQLGLAIYSGFAAYSVYKNNLDLGLLLLGSVLGAMVSVYLIIKSASDSWRLEQEMKSLTPHGGISLRQ